MAQGAVNIGLSAIAQQPDEGDGNTAAITQRAADKDGFGLRVEKTLDGGGGTVERGGGGPCIAMTAGYDWGEGGADAMILLYEPVNRIVLMTFDYS